MTTEQLDALCRAIFTLKSAEQGLQEIDTSRTELMRDDVTATLRILEALVPEDARARWDASGTTAPTEVPPDDDDGGALYQLGPDPFDLGEALGGDLTSFNDTILDLPIVMLDEPEEPPPRPRFETSYPSHPITDDDRDMIAKVKALREILGWPSGRENP